MPIWHGKMSAVRRFVRLAILSFAMQAAIGETAELPTLTSAREVRELAPAEADRGYPIHLEAVVTYRDFRPHTIFAQDATAGIYVSCETDCSTPEIGERVAIDGASAVRANSPRW